METKTKRHLKIYDKQVVRDQHTIGRHYITVPWLNVSGIWLEQAGFHPGDRIDVTVAEGQLVITKVA